jgi:hypothetical protein
MRVRIEKTPARNPWMEAYVGLELPVIATKKTDGGITAIQVQTVDGPTWYAAHNLRRVEEQPESETA